MSTGEKKDINGRLVYTVDFQEFREIVEDVFPNLTDLVFLFFFFYLKLL